jgi:hypothetical protein
VEKLTSLDITTIYRNFEEWRSRPYQECARILTVPGLSLHPLQTARAISRLPRASLAGLASCSWPLLFELLRVGCSHRCGAAGAARTQCAGASNRLSDSARADTIAAALDEPGEARGPNAADHKCHPAATKGIALDS